MRTITSANYSEPHFDKIHKLWQYFRKGSLDPEYSSAVKYVNLDTRERIICTLDDVYLEPHQTRGELDNEKALIE